MYSEWYVTLQCSLPVYHLESVDSLVPEVHIIQVEPDVFGQLWLEVKHPIIVGRTDSSLVVPLAIVIPE